MKRFAVPVVLVMLLAGCAGQAQNGGAPNPDAPPMVGPGGEGESAALGLVNLWRVGGAPGETPETWLRFDAQEFQLWRDCGMVNGSWRATETLFLGSVWGASGDCAVDGLPVVDWLDFVTGFTPTAAGYDLTAADGSTVASLAIDGAPEPIPTAAKFYTEPPEITDEVRSHFAAASALPAALPVATPEQLEAKWVPVAYAVSTDPHVTFNADGTWTGSDGCNGGGGRWALGQDGEFLATSGMSTLIACEGAPVPSWVAQASTAAINSDGWLLLFDAAGAEAGRLKAA